MTEVLVGDAVSTDLHRPSSTRVVLGRQMSLRVRLSKSCWLDRYLRPSRHPALRSLPDTPPVI